VHFTPSDFAKSGMTLRSWSGASFARGGSFAGSSPIAASSLVRAVAVGAFIAKGAVLVSVALGFPLAEVALALGLDVGVAV
jgi:hypothetical protein